LIHNSWFWRRWKLQFGSGLAEDGVIDPRGLVSQDYHDPVKDAYALKGYPVRSWRMWCDSGKAYHREVNKKRNAQKPASGGVPMSTSIASHSAADSITFTRKQLVDEVVRLAWMSPLSKDARLYQFQYADLEFSWKGTSTLKETRRCGFFLRYHHLKLVVKVPVNKLADESPASHEEHCLAKYTSSIATEKAGTLELYDAVIENLLTEHVEGQHVERPEDVKKTRLYDIVVATAMCMIIAEWQKRETIKTLIELALAGESAIAA